MVTLAAQQDASMRYRTGVLPQFNLSADLSDDWRLASKIESRQLLRAGVWGEEPQQTYEYVLTDASAVLTSRGGSLKGWSVGYMLRVADDLTHRALQQYSSTQQLGMGRIGHRFRSDQTWRKQNKTEFRFRYRLSLQVPLQGQQLDDGEFYLKVNQEQLLSIQGDETDIELRLIPMIGWRISDQVKWEIGLDYRLDGFINRGTRSSFWIVIGAYYTFDLRDQIEK